MIKKWEYSDGNYSNFRIELHNNHLNIIQKHGDKIIERKSSFKDFLTKKYVIINCEIEYDICKNIVKLKKPENLNLPENKIWMFWEAIDNSKIFEERIFTENNQFLSVTKFGFADGCVYENKREVIYSWQNIDNFFFYGPNTYNIPVKDRVRLKNEIIENLKQTNYNITFDEGFVIFDYDKIKDINFEFTEGIRGVYFKVNKGKVTVGGWDNPKDGGENYSSVEYLWYNLDMRLPAEFKDKKEFVKSVLQQAIINYSPSKKEDLSTPPTKS